MHKSCYVCLCIHIFIRCTYTYIYTYLRVLSSRADIILPAWRRDMLLLNAPELKRAKKTSRCIASHRGEDPRAATYRERYNIFRCSFVGGRSGDSVCILSDITCIYILTLRLSGAAPRRRKARKKTRNNKRTRRTRKLEFSTMNAKRKLQLDVTNHIPRRSPPIFAILYIVHHSIGH